MIARMRSIKKSLFFRTILITSVLLIALGAYLYFEMRSSVLNSVEHILHSKSQILKGLFHEEQGAVEFELAEAMYGEYSIPRSGHYYKVVFDGDVLAWSPSLASEDFDLDAGEAVIEDPELLQQISVSAGPANERIMVLRHDFSIFGKQASIYAAQSLEEEIAMIRRFRTVLFGVIALNILVLAFVALWTAKQSLRPLDDFSESIQGITHRNLERRIDPKAQAEEIGIVAESFNSMLDRLEAAFESEKKLIADASHELKTPLSIIKAQCEVLLQKERSKEEYLGALEKINGISDRMKKVIEDMLMLTRIDSGIISSANFSRISLAECIERALKLVEFLSGTKNISITKNIQSDAIVNGDPDSLTELFLNIIENAVKYSLENGSVTVSLKEQDSEAAVEITDCGRGIGQEEIGRIFDRFYRAHGSRNTEGTGLGLSIAKAVAETHGGEINVNSEPGKGCTFVITLPTVLNEVK